MRKFGVVSLMFVGFVAGIIFVYSCGGGGSIVLAEITDVTGLEAGLDAINTSIQGIENSTDVSGVVTAINGISPTDVSGIVSELQNIDLSLQEIKLELASTSQDTLSINHITGGAFPQVTWTPVGGTMDIINYRTARFFVATETTNPTSFNVRFGAGSVLGAWQTVGNTDDPIHEIGILGDVMEMTFYNGHQAITDLNVVVQLVR